MDLMDVVMGVIMKEIASGAKRRITNSGLSISGTFAIAQGKRLLKLLNNDPNFEERNELMLLQQRLESKIQVISPAIDMIELITARGNTSLESAVSLTKALRLDIQDLGQRLAKAAASEELFRSGSKLAKARTQIQAELDLIIVDIKKLLVRIEDAVPLMNLAITTSGAKLSTNLPSTISPSRLLQASTLLATGDTQYSMSPSQAVQIGPTFTLSMYMLFAGHLRPHDVEGIRETTWKEVIHKARVKLRRVPMDLAFKPEGRSGRNQLPAEARADEFSYQMLIIEDLDDERVHTFEEGEPQPQNYEGVDTAGIREILPIHQISKIFYADTGKILNIGTEGEINNPVLLLKRDINAIPPRRMVERDEADYDYDQEGWNGGEDEEIDEIQAQIDAQLNGGATRTATQRFDDSSIPDEWRIPNGLDPEWIAFEVYSQDEPSDTESEAEFPRSPSENVDPRMMGRLKEQSPSPSPQRHMTTTTVSNPMFGSIRTSLSLLEIILRLTSLQQFQQQSHLSISDELLNFFLEESSTTGAGGDEQHRQRLRHNARRRVGWDPYDESPVKHRGEAYQHGTPIDYQHDADEFAYSPTNSTRGYQLRSRENTPETPLQGRRSPSVRSDSRLRTMRRGLPNAVDEVSRRGSPLSTKPTTVPDGETDPEESLSRSKPGHHIGR